MIINTFVTEKIHHNWLLNASDDLKKIHQFNFHNTFHSLKNELDLKNSFSIAIIDLEDPSYELFTNNYFKENTNVVFIGVVFERTSEEILEALNKNIKGIVCTTCNSLELLKVINNVSNRQICLCDTIKDVIINEFINNRTLQVNNKSVTTLNEQKFISHNVLSLTAKEKQVCDLLTKGLSYKEIAVVLGVSASSINQKVKSLYKKVDVKSRSELSYRILC